MLVASCGASDGPAIHLRPGRAEGPPALDALPELDVPEDTLTPPMREGLRLAAAVFELPRPPAPPSEPDADLGQWNEEALEPWLALASERIDAARAALDVAAEQAHRQRVAAGAVLGLLYEHVGLSIRSVATPAALRGEPEIEAVFRDVLRGHSRPLLERASRAYRACARNAVRPERFRHWGRFCDDRRAELPDLPPAALRSGETEVEVVPD